MAFVALAVIISTAVGIVCEHRLALAPKAARTMLGLMLYALVPFISFVNFAHLRLTAGAALGLAMACVGLLCAGALTWLIAHWALRLPRPSQGALICAVILVNTGYLGLPMSSVLLGTRALPSAVAYDQVIAGPMLFLFGFAVGAAFGRRGEASPARRVRTFLTRNPPLLAAIAGLLAPVSLAPAGLVNASHVVVVLLLPVGFFAVGVSLSSERREDRAPLLERPDRRVGVAVAMRMCLTPLLLAGFSTLAIRVPSAYLLQAAMPTGVNSLVVGHAYGLDQRLIATVIVWSTALALLAGVVIAAL